MKSSFNDEQRLAKIRSGVRTGVDILSALSIAREGGIEALLLNRPAAETIILHYLTSIRLGFEHKPPVTEIFRLMDKFLGDVRCPNCDIYWRSDQPRSTVYQTVFDASGNVLRYLKRERCMECKNLANEAVELPERPITK